MAVDPSRTEKATPKRRNQAREEGSVLRVPDLDATIMLWVNLFLFMGLWSSAFVLMAQQFAFFFRKAGEGGLNQEALGLLGVDLMSILGRILLPFLGMNFVVALVNQFAQHGFHISFKPLMPKFTKLNPVPGFKRLVSARSFVDILKSLVKFLIMAWMAYLVLGDRLPTFLTTMRLPLKTSLGFLQETLFILYRNVIIAMVALATADFLYQRYEYEKNIRMTKQEVKDEAKESEGSPEIKGRQRSLMMQAAMRRIATQVPKASVVITNPTHFAVALKYDQRTAAPILVAKGVDHLAFKIREKAKESGVVVVENPPLARALYWSVDLDEPIPPELYQAVAQVLAYVYRLKGAA